MERKSFINKSQEPVSAPSGVTFYDKGLVASWSQVFAWYFYDNASGEEKLRQLGATAFSGTRVFFLSEKAAENAVAELGLRSNFDDKPNEIYKAWWFQADTDTCLVSNMAKFAERRGEVTSYQAEVTGYRSYKNRHQFIIASTATVIAMAQYLGFDCPIDMNILTADDLMYDDNTVAAMIGGNCLASPENPIEVVRACGHTIPVTQTKNGKFYVPWQSSVMWILRTQAWAHLGESDPMTNDLMNRKEKTKFATASKKLSECLEAVYYPWKTWCALLRVPNPAPSAIFQIGDNTGRRVIPGVLKFFGDEKEAIEYANIGGGDNTGGLASSSELKVPSPYAGSEDLFQSAVETFASTLTGNESDTEILAAIKADDDFAGCDPAEVKQWVDTALA